MDQILSTRSRIYTHFHGSSAGPDHFFRDKHASEYAAYYTAMYLIQDTGESASVHMQRGFSSDPHIAYIEFWGVMQAVFIQQDAILELYNAVIGSWRQLPKNSAWSKIRDLRNLCAGHPANRSNGAQRAFMGRNFGNYSRIQYELWDVRTPSQPSHPVFDLGLMIESYDLEGAEILNEVLNRMSETWPIRP